MKTPTLTASALLLSCGLLLTGCSSLKDSDVGRLADDAADDIRTKSSDILSGEDSAQGEGHSVTVREVTDGDTVEIEPAIRGRSDLRLIGVDSPELDSSEPLSQQAADFTERRLEGEQVMLTLGRDPVDQYGRLLGTVKAAGGQRTHGATLLESGYAQTLFYEPNTGYRPLYEATQENARQRQAGIWGLSLAQRCELANNGNGLGAGSPECEG